MNDDNENVLIIAYNLFCTILIPAVIVLTGIWSFGVGERFHTWTNRRIADGGIDLFVP